MGLLNTWLDLIEGLIKKHIYKAIKKTIGNLHMRRKGLQSTRRKPPYTYLEDKCETNVVFSITVDPSKTKKWKI